MATGRQSFVAQQDNRFGAYAYAVEYYRSCYFLTADGQSDNIVSGRLAAIRDVSKGPRQSGAFPSRTAQTPCKRITQANGFRVLDFRDVTSGAQGFNVPSRVFKEAPGLTVAGCFFREVPATLPWLGTYEDLFSVAAKGTSTVNLVLQINSTGGSAGTIRCLARQQPEAGGDWSNNASATISGGSGFAHGVWWAYMASVDAATGAVAIRAAKTGNAGLVDATPGVMTVTRPTLDLSPANVDISAYGRSRSPSNAFRGIADAEIAWPVALNPASGFGATMWAMLQARLAQILAP